MKLRGLVAEQTRLDVGEASRLGLGASLILDGVGWLYFPERNDGLIGVAVTWARTNAVESLNLVVDEGAAELAFVAAAFDKPQPIVWRVDGRSLHRVEPSVPAIAPPPACSELTAQLSGAGLEVVADHEVWLGEINGLEVARVGMRDGVCSIDIGVGAYDQFASAAIDTDRDIAASLIRVAGLVRPHRTAGAPPHPIGRLVRARWLRAQAVRDPRIVGLENLNPIPLLRARPGLSELQPAAAIASASAQTVLVVFAVGLDLAVAETAGGLAELHQPDSIMIVVPERDRHPRIVESVDSLSKPADVVALEGEWSD